MRAAWTEPIPVRSAYSPVWSLRTPSFTGCCATAAVSPAPHNMSASAAITLRRMNSSPCRAECRTYWRDRTGEQLLCKAGRWLLLPRRASARHGSDKAVLTSKAYALLTKKADARYGSSGFSAWSMKQQSDLLRGQQHVILNGKCADLPAHRVADLR